MSINLDISIWFALCAAALVVAIFILQLLRDIWRLFNYLIILPIRKYLLFAPPLHRHHRTFDRLLIASRLHACCLVLFLVANIVCLGIKVEALSEVGIRAARLSVINFILVYSMCRINAFTNYSHISFSVHRGLHFWIGLVAMLEGVTHAVVSGSQIKNLSSDLYAIIVG